MNMQPERKYREGALDIHDCLEKKLAAFKQFYSASLSLEESLAAGTEEQIGRIIEERQHCIDAINRIDGILLEIRQQDLRSPSPGAAEIRARIKTLSDGIAETLREIAVVDARCTVAAASRLEDLQREIQAMPGRRQVRSDRAPRTSRFLDLKL